MQRPETPPPWCYSQMSWEYEGCHSGISLHSALYNFAVSQHFEYHSACFPVHFYMRSSPYSWQLEMSMDGRSTHTFSRMPSTSSDVYSSQNRRSVCCTHTAFAFLFIHILIVTIMLFLSFYTYTAIQTVGKGRSLLLQAKVKYLLSN